MLSNLHVLIVIPARGGSKGIPRKNLRYLNGKPLIYYSINLSKSLEKYNCKVVVSSDDNEILSIAEKLGAHPLRRPKELAEDAITLDPVIENALIESEKIFNIRFDLVVTLQPTSPLLSKESLEEALEQFVIYEIDTILSAIDDTHLTWRLENGEFIPNFENRLNRQQLPKVYKETGGFLITRRKFVTKNSRIGKKIKLFEVPAHEAIDIDTYEDWQIAEYFLRQKTVLFVVSGYRDIGLGHVYNSLSIAQEIMNHNLIFLVDKRSDLAFQTINKLNYPVVKQKHDSILVDIIDLKPDIVINDILDTSAEYIQSLKEQHIKVINFEDLGEGAKYADLVINAMYPEKEVLPNHFFGSEYFILREEFLLTPQKRIDSKVNKVLISFGGVDPNNFTEFVLSAINDWCMEQGIKVEVIIGPGYDKIASLKPYKSLTIHRNVSNISSIMYSADIAFTSGGRTTFELASIGIPSIVMAQNERELTHFFCSAKNGFVNLGLGIEVDKHTLLKVFVNLVKDYGQRKYMNQLMLANDLRNSKKRVMKKIKYLINDENH